MDTLLTHHTAFFSEQLFMWKLCAHGVMPRAYPLTTVVKAAVFWLLKNLNVRKENDKLNLIRRALLCMSRPFAMRPEN
jgi:hypothetical protein